MLCRCSIPSVKITTKNNQAYFVCGYNPRQCKMWATGPVLYPTTKNIGAKKDRYVRMELGYHPVNQEECVIVYALSRNDPGVQSTMRGLVTRNGLHSAEPVVVGPRAAYLAASRLQVPEASEGANPSGTGSKPPVLFGWDNNLKGWIFPLSLYDNVCVAVAAITPPVPYDEIPRFVFDCVRRIQSKLTAQRRAESEIGTVMTLLEEEKVVKALKPFQRRGVQFVLDHCGRAMIADEMGLGKTIQAIAAMAHYRKEWPVLVVCPGSLCENWAREFNQWLGLPYGLIKVLYPVSGGKRRSEATELEELNIAQVVIVGYHNLKLVPFGKTFKCVILDECHYIKNGDAKRSKQVGTLCSYARRLVLLSGTPAMSRPIELFPQILLLEPQQFLTKTQFGARYCAGIMTKFGCDMTGHSNLMELNMLLGHFVIRRTKKEVAGEMPSKMRRVLYMHVTDKEKALLGKKVSALRSAVSGGKLRPQVSDPNTLELRALTGKAKLPALRDYLKEVLNELVAENKAALKEPEPATPSAAAFSSVEEGVTLASPTSPAGSDLEPSKRRLQKIIIFAHHLSVISEVDELVSSVLHKDGFDHITVQGDVAIPEREKLCLHFRDSPRCCVAVLSMMAMGTGHNFTCANRVIFTELDWNPSTHLQCEDRVHRIGQDIDCYIEYLLADGTADEAIWPMLQEKLDVTHATLDSSEAEAVRFKTDNDERQCVQRKDTPPVIKPPSLEGWLSGSGQKPSAAAAAADHSNIGHKPVIGLFSSVSHAQSLITRAETGKRSAPCAEPIDLTDTDVVNAPCRQKLQSPASTTITPHPVTPGSGEVPHHPRAQVTLLSGCRPRDNSGSRSCELPQTPLSTPALSQQSTPSAPANVSRYIAPVFRSVPNVQKTQTEHNEKHTGVATEASLRPSFAPHAVGALQSTVYVAGAAPKTTKTLIGRDSSAKRETAKK